MIHRDEKPLVSGCWRCASSNLARTGSEVWCRACLRTCYHECADCGEPGFGVEKETDDDGKHWLCGKCRADREAEDRLDNMHPADALAVTIRGRWR